MIFLVSLEFKKGGVYDIRYARFENCGVQNITGRYCSHFHYSSTCPQCKMIGNAYENAIQSSVTIHGTHQSLVDNNVMWNSRNSSTRNLEVLFTQNDLNFYDLWKFHLQWAIFVDGMIKVRFYHYKLFGIK